MTSQLPWLPDDRRTGLGVSTVSPVSPAVLQLWGFNGRVGRAPPPMAGTWSRFNRVAKHPGCCGSGCAITNSLAARPALGTAQEMWSPMGHPAQLWGRSQKWELGGRLPGALPHSGDTSVGSDHGAHTGCEWLCGTPRVCGVWTDPWDMCIETHGTPIGPCDTDVPMGVSMAPWSTDGIIGHPWNIHGSMELRWLCGTHMTPWDIHGSMGHI